MSHRQNYIPEPVASGMHAALDFVLKCSVIVAGFCGTVGMLLWGSGLL